MASARSLLGSLALLAVLVNLISAQMFYGTQEDKRNFDREFMHFGKRSGYQLLRPVAILDKRASEFDRNFMPFGKRFSAYEPQMEKKQFNREFMHFGKRSGAGFYPDSEATL